MGIFRRKQATPADPRPAIAAFWAWWAQHRGEVLAALRDGRPDDLVSRLRPAVTTIDEGLEWEVSPGTSTTFLLVVSSGRPELRGVAERWLLAAPDDPDVGFAAARPRDLRVFETAVLAVDDYDIAFAELVAGTRVDPQRGKLDVVVHHPLFPLLGADDRMQVAYLGVTAALGQDDLERWLGTIEVSADMPIDAIPLSTLGVVVDQLRPAADQWSVLQGQGPKGQILALIRRPFARVDRPLADTHVGIVLRYEANETGLPLDPEVGVEVEHLEERILDALGGDGPHVVHIGHVTGGGEVVLHYYVDGLEAQPEALTPMLAEWSRGDTSMRVDRDPGWARVAPLLG
ncbi:MAG TPA: hypothetical protein VFQ15_01395 [Jiangellaceae bacterium]|nr:hypothetical protein [Jiangellaceae bacterium]